MDRAANLTVASERRGDTAVLTATGELDIATAGVFFDALMAALRDGTRDLLIDLRGVTFIDSGGVRALVHARRRLWRRDGAAVVLCADGPVVRTLRLMGLYDVLDCTTSESDAHARVGLLRGEGDER